MEAIQAMTMFEKYYTADQLEQIEQRRKSFSDEQHDQFHRDWEELIARAGRRRRGARRRQTRACRRSPRAGAR